VVTGRLMLLADGQRPPETPDHAQAAIPPQWNVYIARRSAGQNRAFALTLYQGAREDDCGVNMENFPTPISHAGAWCRFAIYFDTEVEGRRPLMISSACWLETDAGPPPAGDWGHDEAPNPQWRAGHPLGFGLFAYNCWIQVSALKLVPLGPDLPQAPAGLGRREK
jgi:hypothetical protein